MTLCFCQERLVFTVYFLSYARYRNLVFFSLDFFVSYSSSDAFLETNSPVSLASEILAVSPRAVMAVVVFICLVLPGNTGQRTILDGRVSSLFKRTQIPRASRLNPIQPLSCPRTDRGSAAFRRQKILLVDLLYDL